MMEKMKCISMSILYIDVETEFVICHAGAEFCTVSILHHAELALELFL